MLVAGSSACDESANLRGPVQFQMGGSIQGIPLSLGGTVSTVAGSAYQWGSSDGSGAAAEFAEPYGLTSDGSFLYISEKDGRRVRKMNLATGEVSTIASSGFSELTGITTDGIDLYVADRGDNSIKKVVIATGTVTTFAGGSRGSSDGVGTAAQFNQPYGITTDNVNLYVTDRENNTIRKIVIATAEVSTIAGSPGAWGSSDGVGAAARFNEPRGITTDGSSLFVTDWLNHTVRRISINGGVVSTFAGSAGNSGSDDGSGGSARFYRPRGISSDGTNLFVADYCNDTVRKIVIATAQVSTLAGSGLSGASDGAGTSATFDEPCGITTDGQDLYVSDRSSNIIRRID